MVELDSVSVRFEGRAAVDTVTASVGRGEWVGLIGANGAGKTTLLRALVGLVEHEGEVRIGGTPTTAMGRRQRARAVAYVPQAPELPADMSVFDYTLLGRTPHIAYLAVESGDDLDHCARLLERLELAGLSQRHLSTLSGGERQRVVLARALAQEAPVLLMDEPTSALDLAHRVEALEIVDELRHEWGLTVVSAMHDLTLAGQFADRLLLLSGGSVAAFGAPGRGARRTGAGGGVRLCRPHHPHRRRRARRRPPPHRAAPGWFGAPAGRGRPGGQGGAMSGDDPVHGCRCPSPIHRRRAGASTPWSSSTRVTGRGSRRPPSA